MTTDQTSIVCKLQQTAVSDLQWHIIHINEEQQWSKGTSLQNTMHQGLNPTIALLHISLVVVINKPCQFHL